MQRQIIQQCQSQGLIAGHDWFSCPLSKCTRCIQAKAIWSEMHLLAIMFFFSGVYWKRPLLFRRLISETDGSSAAVTSYLIIPSRDVVSRRDGDALPPGPVPAAVRIAGEDALPASVAIATAVSQRQSLDLHRRANIQMSLRRKRCNRLYFLIQ